MRILTINDEEEYHKNLKEYQSRLTLINNNVIKIFGILFIFIYFFNFYNNLKTCTTKSNPSSARHFTKYLLFSNTWKII